MKRIYISLILLLPFVLPVIRAKASDTDILSTDTTRTIHMVPYQISEINYALERTEQMLSLMKYQLEPDASVIRINSAFQSVKKELQQEYLEFKDNKQPRFTRFFLENSYFIWQDYRIKLHKWQVKVNAKIQQNQQHIGEVENMIQKWEITLQDQKILDQSENTRFRISDMIAKINQVKMDLQTTEKDLFNLENGITNEISFCSNMIGNITHTQEEIRKNFLIAETQPLWRIRISAYEFTPIRDRLQKLWNDLQKYLKVYARSESTGMILVFFLACVLVIVLVRMAFSKYVIADMVSEGITEIRAVLFTYPVFSALTVFLGAFPLLFPFHPILVAKLIKVFLLIAARYLIFESSNRQGRQFISKLILLLILNYIQFVFWYFGNVSRYFIEVESIVGLIILFPYFSPSFWKNARDEKLIYISGILAIQVFAFYLFSIIANLFGYLDLTHYLIKAGIHIPVMAVILFAVYKVWIALAGAILLISKSFKQNYISHYWEKLEKRVTRLVAVAVFLFWLIYLIFLFEIQKPILLWLIDFLLKERTVGTLEITINSILSFLIILVLTFLLTGVIRFIVDDDFVKHSKLPRGVAAAISVTLRYLIVVFGIMFALSAGGVELGKFSLLAGALGVGIGFGLQNIVNNFISGLILVYERPLQVGDTIEIENLLGQVKKIGLRSSHVLTYDGAEVVVPNGNLISTQLINWTLSDNQRRMEIKTGVAYGTDPKLVLRLLQDVALGNEDILKQPPAVALFDGFGDSSLNFRLLFWTPYDKGIGIKSDVSIAIYNIFKENNIEIPFPQMDLHIKKKEETG